MIDDLTNVMVYPNVRLNIIPRVMKVGKSPIMSIFYKCNFILIRFNLVDYRNSYFNPKPVQCQTIPGRMDIELGLQRRFI